MRMHACDNVYLDCSELTDWFLKTHIFTSRSSKALRGFLCAGTYYTVGIWGLCKLLVGSKSEVAAEDAAWPSTVARTMSSRASS